MKKYSAKELIEIRNGLSYMSKDNFIIAMNLKGIFDKYIIEQHYRDLKGVNLFHLLENENTEIMTAVLNFNRTVISKAWDNSFHGDRQKVMKKIIFEKDEKMFSKELDLNSYTGSKVYYEIHENSKVIEILNLCDSVSRGNQPYTNIYEGDIICSTDGFRHKGSDLYLALIDNKYTNYPSYYKKLIFTQEFGFLNPESAEPFTDGKKYKFEESIFNVTENQYNYHCFTIGDGFSVIGNMFLDTNIFENLK